MKTHPNAEDIALFAEIIHRGQTTDDGKPYIQHSEAVASIAENIYMEENAIRANLDSKKLQDLLQTVDMIRQIGLLHDSIENHPKHANKKTFLAKNIHPRVISCVELLTKNPKLSYEENIYRVTTDEYATIVKRADLAHNAKTQRLPARIKAGHTLEKTLLNNKKYILSYLFLSKSISQSEYHNNITTPFKK